MLAVVATQNSYCARNIEVWFETDSAWHMFKDPEIGQIWKCNIYSLLSHPYPSPPEGEDFSNELPSSSSSLSLPSTPSLSSSSPSSPDLPHSPVVPHPESPLSPVTHGNLRLEVAAPHYHEDQLQVKVYWKMSHHGELFYCANQKDGRKIMCIEGFITALIIMMIIIIASIYIAAFVGLKDYM